MLNFKPHDVKIDFNQNLVNNMPNFESGTDLISFMSEDKGTYEKYEKTLHLYDALSQTLHRRSHVHSAVIKLGHVAKGYDTKDMVDALSQYHTQKVDNEVNGLIKASVDLKNNLKHYQDDLNFCLCYAKKTKCSKALIKLIKTSLPKANSIVSNKYHKVSQQLAKEVHSCGGSITFPKVN